LVEYSEVWKKKLTFNEDNISHIRKSNNSLEELKESLSEKRTTSKNDILTRESKKKWAFTKNGLVSKKNRLYSDKKSSKDSSQLITSSSQKESFSK
jgi:hypothetical protein